MFIDHMRRDFYDLCFDDRVLVIAAHDVDAVCATKIMLHLFRMDNIAYTLVTVQGVDDLRDTFKDYVKQAKVVILINCGGTIDILDLCGNPKDTIFFVMDNHRPIHILNIYNASKQVRIVSPPMDDDGIPAFDDIFQDEPDSDGESEEEPEDQEADQSSEDRSHSGSPDSQGEPRTGTKRKQRYNSSFIQKRKTRQQWEENRRMLLNAYTQYTCYGAPASLVALEVAWALNRDQNDIVWWAIVGLTDFITMNRIDRSNYTLLVTQMQNHIARVNHSNTIPLDCLKINFENEPNLFLYRQWNLYDSMKLTPHFACKFKVWTQKGQSRFHQYLAEVGLPLAQVKQTYTGMDLDLRKNLKTIMARREEKYRLEDLPIGSFIGQCGYKYKYSALDNHLATLALLEAPNDKSPMDKFLLALHSLSKERYQVLDVGIAEAKVIVTAIYKQVIQLLELKQINCFGAVMYVIMQESGPDSRFFLKPNVLIILTHFVLRAFVAHSTGWRQRHLPLVLISPPSPDGNCLAIGIPPVTADVSSNLFGKAFEQLKIRFPSDLNLDCFDPNICKVKSEEKQNFIEHLLALLS